MSEREFRLSAKWLKRLAVTAVIGAVMVPTAVIAAGGAFTDDDTSVFEANIEWLAASGVTAGCNPPDNTQFCPDDNVTRGQMAAFMQRFAQYISAEDGTPAEADNADTLDGLDSADLLPVIAAKSGDHAHGTGLGTINSGGPFESATVDITTPAGGVLKLSGITGWEGGDVWFTQWIEVDEPSPCDNWNDTDRVPGTATQSNAQLSGATAASIGVVEVPAGTHTLSLCLWPFSGSGSLNVTYSLIGEWFPATSIDLQSTDAGQPVSPVGSGPSAG